ncbi:MAG TPA: helix-turn-helix domain-containing protein [Acidimicrobiales bacterium]|nr:helix-turn-helix domain-containing protein [Acidimicrobiales bacterium]
MARSVKRQSSRTYASPKRDEQAKATRWSILEAARRLFVANGYGATTLKAVAEEAGVAVQTVYAVFGNKRELLKQATDVSIVGDDEPFAISERAAAVAVDREKDPKKRARMSAAVTRGIVERARAIAKVTRDAAAVDPEVADLYRRGSAERRRGMEGAARGLAGPQKKLRVPIDDAAETLFVLYSPDVAILLIDELGWSLDKYEEWLAMMLERTLLP